MKKVELIELSCRGEGETKLDFYERSKNLIILILF
jgi:hypothetical protein